MTAPRTVVLCKISSGLIITPATVPAATQNAAYSVTLTAKGGTGSSYTFVRTGSLPTGLTGTDNGNGTYTISGTPTVTGTFPFKLYVRNTNGWATTQQYTIQVPALTLQYSQPLAITRGIAVSNVQLLAAGGTGAGTYVFSQTGLPAGLTLNTSTGVITGTVTAAVGTYSVNFSVHDSVPTTVNLTQSIIVRSRLALVKAPTVCEVNKAYSFQLAVTGATGAVTWAVTSGSLPAGLSLSAGGLFSGTPTSIASPIAYSVTATDAGTGDTLVSAISHAVALKLSFGNYWLVAGSTAFKRVDHTMTLLNNGKVLVAGGGNSAGTGVTATCELYDPNTNVWSTVGSLATARKRHTATLLASGKVLVTGGDDQVSTSFASCEIFDPATNAWTAAHAMVASRTQHTATLLNTGNVLVVCGNNTSVSVTTAELYNPTTDTWSAAGSPGTSKFKNHTAVLLGTGNVIIVAGVNVATTTGACDLYNTAGNSWSAAGTLTNARKLHTTTLLASGKVLAAGGQDASLNRLTSCELYDSGTNAWTATGSLAIGRDSHSSCLMSNNNVITCAGFMQGTVLTQTCEIFDTALFTWSSAAAMRSTHAVLTTVKLNTSNSILAVGSSSTGTYPCELYIPSLLTDRSYLINNIVSDSIASSVSTTGVAPYTFAYSSWSAGGLPPVGLSFNSDGTITGMPTASITESVSVTVTDALGATAVQTMNVIVKKTAMAAQQAGVALGAQGGFATINITGGGATGSSDDNVLNINVPASAAGGSSAYALGVVGASAPVDFSISPVNTMTLTASTNCTATVVVPPNANTLCTLRVTQSASSFPTLTFPASFKAGFFGGTIPKPAQVGNVVTTYVFDYDGANFNLISVADSNGATFASATQAGLMSTLAQTFAGAKTFNSGITAPSFNFSLDTLYHDPIYGASIVPIGGSTADVSLWNNLGTLAFYVVSGTVNTQTVGTHTAANLVGTNAVSGAALKYTTGSGGTVTQLTSKATGVTLNKACGQITMINAALAAATSVAFTLTNSTITATSVIIVNIASAATTNSYAVTVEAVAAGSCRIQIRNVSAGSLSEALVLNYAVINSVKV